MLFQTSVETYIKFYFMVSTLSSEVHKGSKMVDSVLSYNLTSHWGEEAVVCEP